MAGRSVPLYLHMHDPTTRFNFFFQFSNIAQPNTKFNPTQSLRFGSDNLNWLGYLFFFNTPKNHIAIGDILKTIIHFTRVVNKQTTTIVLVGHDN